MLREKQLFGRLFPRTEAALGREHPEDMEFIRLALANTDKRIHQGLSVSPAFAYAVLMWPYVRQLLDELEPGEFSPQEALLVCAERAMEHQTRTITIPMRHSRIIRDIWILQPQLEDGPRKNPGRTIARKSFRAAYDFLGLRAVTERRLQQAFDAWTRAQEENPVESTSSSPRRRRRRRR